jgi:hypothetical protein
LLWFVRKRRNLPFSFVFVLFGSVLQKPYDPRELARRIRDTLDLQPARARPA